MPANRIVRIANGQGFWGDSVDAPVRLIEGGPLDYLTLDYLAEVTMSIMQKLRRRDPDRGYATDFIDVVDRVLPAIRERGIRIVANAGGVNPAACRRALIELARSRRATGLKIGTVTGDDILDRLDELLDDGVPLANLDDGRPFDEIRDRVLSANVYIHSFAVADALRQGADIVVSGRTTDPGLVLSPLIAEFGWRPEQWDLLAAGTIAGHIVECGAQCTGGNFSRWWEVEGWERIGYPVLECSVDGTFVVTKHDDTGGMVTVDTVGEQLLYELGAPERYVTPDCTVDFTSVRLDQQGPDRVRVSGVRGRPATDTYKVSIAYLEGYKAVGSLTVSGPDALAKARVCADALWGRLRHAGFDYDKRITEYVGVDACHGGIAPRRPFVNEVVLRVGVQDADRARVDRFGKELAPLVTSGPPGVTGFAGGRPKATEVLGYWPSLIPKDRVVPEISVEVAS
ncbi:MAG TPA: acyclic terpene utilization AtuA family protein [Candidatus Polarisedimenticolaceae bacterium]|nr:acyclic terpene utilization AtuA family protein [Candidatus Polarisedimenticolaceae bacterium]